MNNKGVRCSCIQIELFSKSWDVYVLLSPFTVHLLTIITLLIGFNKKLQKSPEENPIKTKKNQVCQAVDKAQFILVSEDCWFEVSGVTYQYFTTALALEENKYSYFIYLYISNYVLIW